MLTQNERKCCMTTSSPDVGFPTAGGRKPSVTKNTEIIAEVLDWTHDSAEITRLTDRKELFYREVFRERGVEPLAGVREWLASHADFVVHRLDEFTVAQLSAAVAVRQCEIV